MKEGYITINRSDFDSELWTEKRVFSKWEAWTYLIYNAKFKDCDVNIGLRSVHLKRGQLCVSLSYLAKAWGWNKSRVRRFIDLLQSTGRVVCDTPRDTPSDTPRDTGSETILKQFPTHLTICNYDGYIGSVKRKRNDSETPRDTPSDTPRDTNIKERREERKERVKGSSSIEERTILFRESLYPYCKKRGGIYPENMVLAFFEYWSEPNEAGTKMRHELEKTWDIGRRLSRWAKNNKTFSNGKQTKQASAEQSRGALEREAARIIGNLTGQNPFDHIPSDSPNREPTDIEWTPA